MTPISIFQKLDELLTSAESEILEFKEAKISSKTGKN